jgi:DNA modification methylase
LFAGSPGPVDPSHVTFKGGHDEPGHLWYPYLEGFSPQFVRHVLLKYMPSARIILDPFAGTGTTPFTVAAEGLTSNYCEVNPAMRRVIEAKVTAAALPAAHRRRLVTALEGLADSLRTQIESAPPDTSLDANYKACFGKSEFFAPSTYQAVLRLRTLNDTLLKRHPLLGDVLAVAIMSQLILCSRLKRAGDVRYKRPAELAKGVPSLPEAVARQLALIAEDLRDFPSITEHPTLVVANAKLLETVDPINAEGVITSPPYLNGTNYFRNTRLELWYLRQLQEPAHLRVFRDDAITSGINDVRTRAGDGESHPSVEKVVHELRKKAYDARIPRMVADYFADMTIVMRGLAHHTVRDGVVCIDIGDSQYGGVNVPTHELLAEIAESLSFRLKDMVHLRSRVSKDRSALSQHLLVLERIGPRASTGPSNDVIHKWTAFKEQLPHHRHPFTRRNWGHPLHSVCSYSGKMKPGLAYHLVSCFSEPGDVILDPFSGSGTIPFEGALSGRSAYGLDISLLSVAISNAKLLRTTRDGVARLLGELERWIEDRTPTDTVYAAAEKVHFNQSIGEYFHERTYAEILSARRFFASNREDSPEWYLVLACMLHILHGNRPYALSRRSHPITPYAPTGPRIYKPLIRKLSDKINRSLAASYPPGFPAGRCYQADVFEPWPSNIRDVDAIITSPPFFDSTRFYMTNWMRFWFCGWEIEDFAKQPESFMETKQRASFDAYDSILAQSRERIKPGGVVVFHLGFSRKCDMAREVSRIARGYFDILDVFTESVEHCESHGIRDKGTVTQHQFVVLKK